MPNSLVAPFPAYTPEEWNERFINWQNRMVFWLDDLRVIKFGCPALNMSGGQNVTETRLWNEIDGTRYKKFFAAVLDSEPDGQWIIMERANGFPMPDRKTQQRLDSVGKHFSIPKKEIRWANLGYRRETGETIFVDYGVDDGSGYTKYDKPCGNCYFCGFLHTLPIIKAERLLLDEANDSWDESGDFERTVEDAV